jgi:hypothetical protein
MPTGASRWDAVVVNVMAARAGKAVERMLLSVPPLDEAGGWGGITTPGAGLLQPHHTHTRGDPNRVACLTGRPKPNLAQAPGGRHPHSMPPHPSPTDKSFRDTIARRIR